MIDEKIEELIENENEGEYSNNDIFEFDSWGADLSFRELITMYGDDELLKPELQRHYVWDKKEASRFIESILLGLPIPSIFLAKQEDEKLLIIDGYQRIKSVYDYVEGNPFASKAEKENKTDKDGNKGFKLTDSEKINERWRGKSFDKLEKSEQRKIKTTTIHAIIFKQKKPAEKNTGMYQIFERINTSGKTLSPQEIRNCVYSGRLNDLIMELNHLETWRNLLWSKEIDSRMKDVELILRFFALYKLYKNPPQKITSIILKKYLNEFMGDKEYNTDEYISEAKNIFTETINKTYELFGRYAFHNAPKNTNSRTKVNPAIFDSITIALSISDIKKIDKDKMKSKREELIIDKEYKDLVRNRTTNIDNIIARINMAKKYLFE